MFKFLWVSILIIVLISWIVRGVLSYFVRKFIQNNFQPQQRPQRKEGRDGDIHIENQDHHDKKIKKDMGEYVDYEEIK